jgi:hypothetical protein
MIRQLKEKADSISNLEHDYLRGRLREIFISDILKMYLTSVFDVGTGIVVNSNGDQSKETDVIIYDTRILPPFIKEKSIGFYPAESVIAVIEIKSKLRKDEFIESRDKANHLLTTVYDPKVNSLFETEKPICSIFSYYGRGFREIVDENNGRNWLSTNSNPIKSMCILNSLCWFKVNNTWSLKKKDKDNSETKRFIAVLLDNIRTLSEKRYRLLSINHNDYLSMYIR